MEFIYKEPTLHKSWRKIISMKYPTLCDGSCGHEEVDDDDDTYDDYFGCLHEAGCDVNQKQLD